MGCVPSKSKAARSVRSPSKREEEDNSIPTEPTLWDIDAENVDKLALSSSGSNVSEGSKLGLHNRSSSSVSGSSNTTGGDNNNGNIDDDADKKNNAEEESSEDNAVDFQGTNSNANGNADDNADIDDNENVASIAVDSNSTNSDDCINESTTANGRNEDREFFITATFLTACADDNGCEDGNICNSDDGCAENVDEYDEKNDCEENGSPRDDGDDAINDADNA